MKAATLLVLLTSTLFGCSSIAQLIRKDVTGGHIALQGPFMPAMSKARVMMAEHCGGRFEAIEQDESVVFHCRDIQVSAHELRARAGL